MCQGKASTKQIELGEQTKTQNPKCLHLDLSERPGLDCSSVQLYDLPLKLIDPEVERLATVHSRMLVEKCTHFTPDCLLVILLKEHAVHNQGCVKHKVRLV